MFEGVCFFELLSNCLLIETCFLRTFSILFSLLLIDAHPPLPTRTEAMENLDHSSGLIRKADHTQTAEQPGLTWLETAHMFLGVWIWYCSTSGVMDIENWYQSPHLKFGYCACSCYRQYFYHKNYGLVLFHMLSY